MMNTILQILADNARLTNEQLAAMTGKTTVEVAQEIDRLQREGIIKGYKAIVDWDKTDRSLCLARIELKVTPKSGMGFDEIAGTIAQFDLQGRGAVCGPPAGSPGVGPVHRHPLCTEKI